MRSFDGKHSFVHYYELGFAVQVVLLSSSNLLEFTSGCYHGLNTIQNGLELLSQNIFAHKSLQGLKNVMRLFGYSVLLNVHVCTGGNWWKFR